MRIEARLLSSRHFSSWMKIVNKLPVLLRIIRHTTSVEADYPSRCTTFANGKVWYMQKVNANAPKYSKGTMKPGKKKKKNAAKWLVTIK